MTMMTTTMIVMVDDDDNIGNYDIQRIGIVCAKPATYPLLSPHALEGPSALQFVQQAFPFGLKLSPFEYHDHHHLRCVWVSNR